MKRKFIFADEAGDFSFKRDGRSSKYFIACAISMDSCDAGHELLRLKRQLAWEGAPLLDYFHATQDKQAIRDRVYALLDSTDLHIYAQILEKSKAQPQIRHTNHRFYQHAWYYLFRYAMPQIVEVGAELMITTASIGTKKGQEVFSECVKDVLTQTVKPMSCRYRTVFCSSASDPCLQLADYCTWAIQRKWERGDDRAYKLISSKIDYEYDLWAHGTTCYY